MTAEGEPVYVPTGGLFQPTELARGPWTAEAQHGGAPAGLLARTLEREIGDHVLTRISIDLLRPVTLGPLTVRASGGRGRTVGHWEASISAGDRTLVTASALSCATRSGAPAQTRQQLRLPFPSTSQPLRIAGMLDHRSFHYTAMESRLATGSIREPGPAAAWFRLGHPLVGDEPPSPLVRAVAAADFGSGISWECPFDRYPCVNADLTVRFCRPPRGEWIGIDARTTIGPHGYGLTRSELHDLDGPIGWAEQTLIVFWPDAGPSEHTPAAGE